MSPCRTVTVLGDSRAFDTYYTSSNYTVSYGYDKTFAHVWRKAALSDSSSRYDVIHIPDHFRGGTLENNILRLSLTDPDVVVILDGIWETLLNKGHFLEYLERFQGTGEGPQDYSHARVSELFREGKLAVSPVTYARKQKRLISYFRRRRRQVIWMTLPVISREYIGSTYHAGDYTPIETWDDCLRAINDMMVPLVEAYGGEVMDLTGLMAEIGGESAALIDQWHFSQAFHSRIAEVLDLTTRRLLKSAPGPEHISRSYMITGPQDSQIPAEVVMIDPDSEDEVSALAALSDEQILVYPSELGEINNPRGNDRAEFERMDDR